MKTNKLSVLVSALFLIAGFNANAQDANTILKKMDNVMYSPKDMQAKIKMVLIDKNGKQKTREALVNQKGNERRIFKFTSPASQEGIAVLSLPDDIMYLYMPAYGKERRIASHVKNQKFAGTDFSYDDMEAVPFSEKYTPKLIKTEGNYYYMQLVPKSQKSEYSKVIMKINKTNFCPSSAEYYDKGKRKIKTGTYKFVKIGKYWNAQESTIKDLKKNHTTKMIMSNVQYDKGLTDDDFTVRKLKQAF